MKDDAQYCGEKIVIRIFVFGMRLNMKENVRRRLPRNAAGAIRIPTIENKIK